MKWTVLVALLLTTANAGAQTPADIDLAKAYAACDKKRDTTRAYAHIARIKAWAPGWEKCSKIQDDYDASLGKAALDKEAQDKELVDKLAN